MGLRGLFPLLPFLLLAGCVLQPQRPPPTGPEPVSPAASPAACACEPVETLPPLQIPDVERFTPPVAEPRPGELARAADYRLLQAVEWSSLEGLEQDRLGAAWGALRQSCSALKKQEIWRASCEAVLQEKTPGDAAILTLLHEHFTPYRATTAEGGDSGLITGYYQPILNGSRTQSARYRYPLYARPDDLVTVELASLYPELAYKRLRGRLDGARLVPYYSRGEIDIVPSPLAGKEVLWVDDVVDLFFLQIQGSGIVRLEGGESLTVGYAEQNGQPYQSIGKLLISRGELTTDKASMQGIKEWGRRNPDKLRELLNGNPSYVFFRELPNGLSGPLGALGVPLAAERSIAVDPRHIPLGAPVFLSTTYPNSAKPLRRLVMAQDTGGAIKGSVRADFFWGAGFEAGRQAGAMKQQGKMWVLLPRTFVINGRAGATP